MDHPVFDEFTRVLGASTSRRQMFKAVSRVAAGAVGAWLSWDTVAPASILAAGSCPEVNQDGQCLNGAKKVPKPGNTPSVNGCGPSGGVLALVVPQSFGNAPFIPSCNQHDVCYENCTEPKHSCDDAFGDGMLQSCSNAYSSTASIVLRGWCSNMAYAYYQAVSQGGQDAWVAAQQKACECFPSQVYCGCTNKCYPTAEIYTCIDECPATLGCFSALCGPATLETCPC